jgi:hypothetical protein
MEDNTDEASRNDGINVSENDSDDTIEDVSNIDSRGGNANNAPETIADHVSTIEPAPFVVDNNHNQTMMNSTASENFAVTTPVIELTPTQAKFGLLPHGAYVLIPAALSMIAWMA